MGLTLESLRLLRGCGENQKLAELNTHLLTSNPTNTPIQIRQLLAVAAEEVADRCVTVVRQLKGITATYRMTSKGPPTRHSHYASGILTPLQAALDGAAAAPRAPLPPALRVALAAAVFDSVNGRYRQLAEELLSSVRKTESSLKRLKKGRGPEGAAAGDAAGAGAEMSDSEKICLQLYLDAKEHGQQAAKFGLDAESTGSFRALLAVVAPAQQGDSQPGSPVAGAGARAQQQLTAAAVGAVGAASPLSGAARQQQQQFEQQQYQQQQQYQFQQQQQQPPPPGPSY